MGKQEMGGRRFEEEELEPADQTHEEITTQNKWLTDLIHRLPAMVKDALEQAANEKQKDPV